MLNLRDWPNAGKGERWRLETGDVHNLLDEACERIEDLETGRWERK